MHDSLSRLYLLEQIKKDGRFKYRLNINPAVKVKLVQRAYKYLSSFVDTMKLGEQRELGKLGEILAVQLFLLSCTREMLR